MTFRKTKADRENSDLKNRVAAVIDTLRPVVRADGGNIELIDVGVDGVVRVALHGTCVGCPSSSITLTLGIERHLKRDIPEVSRVVCVEPSQSTPPASDSV